MRLLFLVGLLALPAAGAWPRHFMTTKGERVDTPEPHPLAYFTDYPVMRFEDFFCHKCTPEQQIIEAKKTQTSTNLRLIGNLARFGIYEIYYHFEDRGSENADTKLILVKTGADEYREIYHREPSQVDARCLPSRFVTVGDDELLEAQYVVGGRPQPTLDDYFWLDKNGAMLVDFRAIFVAARAAVPAGKAPIRFYDTGGDIPGTYYLWAAGGPLISRVRVMDGDTPGTHYLWAAGGPLIVGETATVEVEFKFDHGK